MSRGGRSWPAVLALLAGVLLAGCAAGPRERPPVATPSSAVIDAAAVTAALEPYGTWIETADHGPVWTPLDTDRDWRPCTAGRWVLTGVGWTWISLEPWGWATDHYGRWDLHPLYGWIWVPGDRWAPAWVTWRAGDGWIGWAPLPAGAVWRPDRGVRLPLQPQPATWSFVEWADFLAPDLRERLIERPEARTLFLERTRALPEIATRDGQPVILEPEVDRVERSANRLVTRRRLEDRNSPVDGRAAVRGTVVDVYRPRIEGEFR